jgi:hypothetical protein
LSRARSNDGQSNQRCLSSLLATSYRPYGQQAADLRDGFRSVSAHRDPHQIGVAQLLDPHDPFVQFGGLIGLHDAVDHLADVGRSVGVIWPVATAFVRAAMMSAASRALVIGDNGNATGRSLRAGYILGSQSGHHGLVRPASSAAIAKSPAGVGWIPGPVRRDRKRGGLLYRLMAYFSEITLTCPISSRLRLAHAIFPKAP